MASQPMLNFQSALNKVFDDVKRTTLENFSTFLAEKDVKYDQEELLTLAEQYRVANTQPTLNFVQKKKEKKTRPPNSYNLYIQQKMREIKEANPELKGKELMKRATTEWNAHKQALNEQKQNS